MNLVTIRIVCFTCLP